MAKADQLGAIDALIREFPHENRANQNEAETRHKIIDTVMQNVLSWPKNRISVEEYTKPGFADYILKNSNDDPVLFVEAKKSGLYFRLPAAHKAEEKSAYISIRKLQSDVNIATALQQVRDYCLNSGCEYAAITNGHEWIFFKTFERGKRWDELQAFVIRGLEFFSSEYTKAQNNLSFISIMDRASLPSLLTSAPPKDRQVYFAKERIPAYAHPITANRLATFLRPIATNFFGVIEDDQTDFMDKCYVSERDYPEAADSMKNLIHDSLTPYFEDFGVQQLVDTGKGGGVGGRLAKNIKKHRGGEVLTLFGGKGAGKSTFIKRVLHHKQPPWLKDHAVIAIVDLLKTPEDKRAIQSAIWAGLVAKLDTNNVLNADRNTLIKELFLDEFEIAERQDLAGLAKNSEAYNASLNRLIKEWKRDHKYCAKRLTDYWAAKSKGVIVVIDNTDQYNGSLQDLCFTIAQQISQLLQCVVLISMREERFHQSKIHGVLDAFQNSGFHISSPKPSTVFLKRIDYTIKALRSPKKRSDLGVTADETLISESCQYLEIVASGLRTQNSPLNTFLTACGHGDIRLSLDLFRSFLLSGYTNVDEMLNAGRWTFQTHQIIKPVMIPKRYFYDEKLSDIPNIFQLRDARHASHFTALRILRKLCKGAAANTAPMISVAELRSYFSETFNMVDDLDANLDILLKHAFIESNNRIDQYSEDLDSVRITSYGRYMFEELAYYFTYIDLICVDAGVYEESVSNYLCEAAKDEYRLFQRHAKIDRINKRLERVKKFIEYLQEQENEEIEKYHLDFPEREKFSYKAMEAFEKESVFVATSAAKQSNRS
jgi:hypothetical protein